VLSSLASAGYVAAVHDTLPKEHALPVRATDRDTSQPPLPGELDAAGVIIPFAPPRVWPTTGPVDVLGIDVEVEPTGDEARDAIARELIAQRPDLEHASAAAFEAEVDLHEAQVSRVQDDAWRTLDAATRDRFPEAGELREVDRAVKIAAYEAVRTGVLAAAHRLGAIRVRRVAPQRATRRIRRPRAHRARTASTGPPGSPSPSGDPPPALGRAA
jgi:hypothetical protein